MQPAPATSRAEEKRRRPATPATGRRAFGRVRTLLEGTIPLAYPLRRSLTTSHYVVKPYSRGIGGFIMPTMEQKSHTQWDGAESDRLVEQALRRLREVAPRSSAPVETACSEVEAARRLQRPNSLRAALTSLHLALDQVERNRAKRARSSRG